MCKLSTPYCIYTLHRNYLQRCGNFHIITILLDEKRACARAVYGADTSDSDFDENVRAYIQYIRIVFVI